MRTVTASVAATLRLNHEKRCDRVPSNQHLDGGLPRRRTDEKPGMLRSFFVCANGDPKWLVRYGPCEPWPQMHGLDRSAEMRFHEWIPIHD